LAAPGLGSVAGIVAVTLRGRDLLLWSQSIGSDIYCTDYRARVGPQDYPHQSVPNLVTTPQTVQSFTDRLARLDRARPDPL